MRSVVSTVKRAVRGIRSALDLRGADGNRYWQERAKKLGATSVINLAHGHDGFAAITERQKQLLFPELARRLEPEDRRILDFGCGPGRFSPGLAELSGARTIGVDPIKSLLDLAPRAANTEYRLIERDRIPVEDDGIDVIWCCLVLGGITNRWRLQRAIAELHRVLRRGGLVFLIENTTDGPSAGHWQFRSVYEYRSLFPFALMEHVLDYEDVGERISVMAGRSLV